MKSDEFSSDHFIFCLHDTTIWMTVDIYSLEHKFSTQYCSFRTHPHKFLTELSKQLLICVCRAFDTRTSPFWAQIETNFKWMDVPILLASVIIVQIR